MKQLALFGAALAWILAVGCSRAPRAEIPPLAVRVETAQPASEAGTAPKSEHIALLRGDTETDLSFKVGGILEKIGRSDGEESWQEGVAVKQGEVLARLKQTDFIAAEQAARAKKELDESLYNRIVELRAKGATSPQEFDVARANLESSKAAWSQADQALNDSQIRAPYDGTILARLANPGETISPGVRVLKIANLERMSAELGVPEKLVDSVEVGKEIPVRVSALEGLAFTGKISEVGAAAKEGARLFKVVIRLDNKAGLLKSGMTASVVLSQPQSFPAGAVLVPLSALVASTAPGDPDQLSVFVVEADGRAHERPVKTDEIVRSSIVITAGLKAGEKVVTVGACNLYNGAPVRTPGSEIPSHPQP